MPGTPLVAGTDGSRHALRAVEWAAREATARGRPLRLVSVPWAWPVTTPPGKLSFAVSQEAGDADLAAARAAVAAAADRVAGLFPGLTVDTDVIPGSPTEVLLGCGAEAAMLVVGSRGAGEFAATMLGSVSRTIATRSPCPAVVVNGGTVAARHEVTVGIREPERSAAAFRFGFEEAALRRGRLVVVHAWHSPGMLDKATHRMFDSDEQAVVATQRVNSQLTGWAQKYSEVEYRIDIVRDHPGRVLAAASAHASLVVLGRHRGTQSGTPAIGSVLHAVLNRARGPVAIIPHR